MRSILLLILFSLILIIGCATAQQNYQTFYDPEYKVIDRGELDVKVISRACSDTFEDALSAAKNNGKFHLRSVVGNQNHRIKYKEVRSYNKQDKICVEMSASSFPP
ncbi:uncharacterized protein METZ01_LOCUS54726 [marine metagenome]|uniref:Lipoprotein n=1 Tax=marine metagenome TaxID=408172 RepID=A0A381SCP4_9ZZZZ